MPGRPDKARHDYARHGATPPFAALGVATGKVIGTCHRRHQHQEFLPFLDHLAAAVVRPPGVTVHVVAGNYGTHDRPRAGDGFARRPEFAPHFAPTSGSWLRPVERSFAQIIEGRIRRGVFKGVAGLGRAIADHLAEHNRDPKPFARTADAILDRLKRVCERTSEFDLCGSRGGCESRE